MKLPSCIVALAYFACWSASAQRQPGEDESSANDSSLPGFNLGDVGTWEIVALYAILFGVCAVIPREYRDFAVMCVALWPIAFWGIWAIVH